MKFGIPSISPTIRPSNGLHWGIAYDSKDVRLLTVSDKHWRVLADAVGLYSFDAIAKILPVSAIKDSLYNRARHVIKVDKLLQIEGFDDMTFDELRDACLMRGMGLSKQPQMPHINEIATEDSEHTKEEYKAMLQAWLASEFGTSPPTKHKGMSSSDVVHQQICFYVLHKMALPTLYVPGYHWH